MQVNAATMSSVAAVATMRVSGRIGWAALPDIETDWREFAAQMARRTDELHATVQDLREQIAAVADAHEDAMSEVRENIGAVEVKVQQFAREGDKRVAVGGLRLQVVGAFLVAVGLVLQGIDIAVSPA